MRPSCKAKGGQRHRDRVVAGATAEFIEAEAGLRCQERHARLEQQFILGKRGHHHALEVIVGGDDAAAAGTHRDDFRAERHGGQTPFGRRVGMGQAAAKRSAQPDRVMRDVRHDGGEQRAGRSRNHRTMKRRVTHAGRDREHVRVDRQTVETGDRVDVDQMRGPRHAKRHHRHETLTAGENAAVERAQLGQLRHHVVDGLWRVIDKRRGFHRVASISA